MASVIKKDTIKKTVTLCIAFVYFIFACGYIIHCARTVKSVGLTFTYDKVFKNGTSKSLPKLNSKNSQNPFSGKFLSRPRVVFNDKTIIVLSTAVLILSILSFFIFQQKVSQFRYHHFFKAHNSASLIVFFHVWRI